MGVIGAGDPGDATDLPLSLGTVTASVGLLAHTERHEMRAEALEGVVLDCLTTIKEQ